MHVLSPRTGTASGPESDSQIAGDIKAAQARQDAALAHARFATLVERHQRRALRIAYQYLRDAADADEAVQDAFIKAFTHLDSFREELSFEIWFTRILVNGCLDRIKARSRRNRWFVSSSDGDDDARQRVERLASAARSPEQEVLHGERRRVVSAALERLPERQRSVFVLTHFGEHTPQEIAAVIGLSESTVRVHLHRAIKKLRGLLDHPEKR